MSSWPFPDPVPLAEQALRGALSSYTSGVTTGAAESFDVDALVEAMASIPPEPIGKWMRAQGFPPESNLLLLPMSWRDMVEWPPSYVRFSNFVSSPILINDPGHIQWRRPSPPRSTQRG